MDDRYHSDLFGLDRLHLLAVSVEGSNSEDNALVSPLHRIREPSGDGCDTATRELRRFERYNAEW